MYVYNEADLLIPLPDTRVVRSDSGYTPASEGFSLANGDQAPFNPDDHPGISLVNGDAIIQMFGAGI